MPYSSDSMGAVENFVRLYLTDDGKSPFEGWFDDLSDARAQDRLLARIARLRAGNFGDWKSVGDGVFELRVDYGPGYRVYFGRQGNQVIILLVGGTKGSQNRDIKQAKAYWHDYKENEEAKDF